MTLPQSPASCLGWSHPPYFSLSEMTFPLSNPSPGFPTFRSTLPFPGIFFELLLQQHIVQCAFNCVTYWLVPGKENQSFKFSFVLSFSFPLAKEQFRKIWRSDRNSPRTIKRNNSNSWQRLFSSYEKAPRRKPVKNCCTEDPQRYM